LQISNRDGDKEEKIWTAALIVLYTGISAYKLTQQDIDAPTFMWEARNKSTV